MTATPNPTCDIVMPISAIEGCSESHWIEVQEILTEAIEKAGFAANIVSNADDVEIIHRRIIQNLYDNPIVVVDVSGKNPNVMFELGMRLAFDKPTIIVKDDRTNYSFDTSPIEHPDYPRDFRFGKIVEFKAKLAEKIAATHTKATTDENYTTFLKHFGEFVVAKIERKEISSQEFILDELRSMRQSIQALTQSRFGIPTATKSRRASLCFGGRSDDMVEATKNKLVNFLGVLNVSIREMASNHKRATCKTPVDFGLGGLAFTPVSSFWVDKIAGDAFRRGFSAIWF